MNGKSGSVHVTVLLILPSGDHRRLPGGSGGWELWWEGCSRQRGQHVQRFRDQTAFYYFRELKAGSSGWSQGEGRGGEGWEGRQVSSAQNTHHREEVRLCLEQERRQGPGWDVRD